MKLRTFITFALGLAVRSTIHSPVEAVPMQGSDYLPTAVINNGGLTMVSRKAWEDYLLENTPMLSNLATNLQSIDRHYQKTGRGRKSCPVLPQQLEDPELQLLHISFYINAVKDVLEPFGIYYETAGRNVEDISDIIGDPQVDAGHINRVHDILEDVDRFAIAERDATLAFIKATAGLPRLGSPSPDPGENIRQLGYAIDEADEGWSNHFVVYKSDARERLKNIFLEFIKVLETARADYSSIRDVMFLFDDAKTMFPLKGGFKAVLGALDSWTECWLEGVSGAFAALESISAAPAVGADETNKEQQPETEALKTDKGGKPQSALGKLGSKVGSVFKGGFKSLWGGKSQKGTMQSKEETKEVKADSDPSSPATEIYNDIGDGQL
ncbi:hypothetical protein ABW19_dt0208808 [Dactylella cylindrospora]|nr:hypothetical protein ABW19_dt0208808 [Dactylella cylindrospora]